MSHKKKEHVKEKMKEKHHEHDGKMAEKVKVAHKDKKK